MTTRRTYPLWNGCEWTFEEIVEDLTGLVKHILLLTTPQEQIQDAMQEVWLTSCSSACNAIPACSAMRPG